MLTITAQEFAKFTASAGQNLNHFKFTKSNIVVILQTLQERSATVKGQRGEEEGEESTEWECIKEHLMITVCTNWTAHVRTGEQKHSTWRNANVVIYTTEIILYIHVVCASDKTFNCNAALHLSSAKKCPFSLWFRMKHLYCFHLCMPHENLQMSRCATQCNFMKSDVFWTQWERLQLLKEDKD